MIKHIVLLYNFIFFFALLHGQYPQKMITCYPVINLRARPEVNTAQLPACDLDNPLQITQLLLGEHLVAHEEFTDAYQTKWLRINTLQQEYFYEPLLWHGYPGWIQANEAVAVDTFPIHNLVVNKYITPIYNQQNQKIDILSIGTRIYGKQITDQLWQISLPNNNTAFIQSENIYFINELVQESVEDLRTSIINTSKMFLDNWYSWGGRSAQNYQWSISSVDCSALIHLSFLAHGLQLPRMSHEQWLQSHHIHNGADLQPGDLVFFTTITKQATRMDHVMLYIADNLLLEATYAGEHKTRIISFEKRLTKRPEHICSGDIVYTGEDIFQIYFGTFLHDKEQIQLLRNNALRIQYNQEFIDKKNIFNDFNYLRFH